MAFPAGGKHPCTEFFILVRTDRKLLCAAKLEARTPFSKPPAGEQCQGRGMEVTSPLQCACEINLPKLGLLENSGLLAHSKGGKKHGPVTTERLGNLLLNQGVQVMRILISDPYTTSQGSCPRMSNMNPSTRKHPQTNPRSGTSLQDNWPHTLQKSVSRMTTESRGTVPD